MVPSMRWRGIRRFQSQNEMTLWRAASLLVAAPAAVALVIVTLLFAVTLVVGVLGKPKVGQGPAGSPEARQGEKNAKKSAWAEAFASLGAVLLVLLKVVGGMLFVCLYLPARVYLVWESFRTLFCLPPEAFIATEWSQYLPRIT